MKVWELFRQDEDYEGGGDDSMAIFTVEEHAVEALKTLGEGDPENEYYVVAAETQDEALELKFNYSLILPLPDETWGKKLWPGPQLEVRVYGIDPGHPKDYVDEPCRVREEVSGAATFQWIEGTDWRAVVSKYHDLHEEKYGCKAKSSPLKNGDLRWDPTAGLYKPDVM